ncbi:MAG TPA: glycosyltransferase, partial [Prosthecobacter sp.]|nr:glycosyltransferase [Prosthecobacter sp.]
MPLRLVFLIRDLSPGGAQRQLVALAAGLAKGADFAVTVLHFYPGPFEEDLKRAGVDTVCIGKRHRWDLCGFLLRLRRALLAARPAVIYSFLNEANLMAILLKPLCGRPKVVWGVRDSRTDADQWGVLGKLSFRLNVWLARLADLIIANSQAGRDYYKELGYPAVRMEVVSNGIDVERFAPANGEELRKEWGGEGQMLVGIIGRLNPMKDHRTFIQAAALAGKARADLRFLIVGEGDAGYRAELLAFAEKVGIADRITWSGARRDMRAVYAALDVVVSTSSFGEGLSNVLAEAMACARPCVATDVGDSAWLLNDREWVCRAGDAGAVAQCVLTLARMRPEQRAEIGARSRRQIVEHLGVQRMIDRTGELLSGVVPAKRITFITTGLGTGGAEMMLWQILTQLDRRRFELAVISLTGGGKYADLLKAKGIPVESLDLSPGSVSLAGLAKLFRCIRRQRPETLVGWMYHGCVAASLAKFFQWRQVTMLWSIRQSLYSLELEKPGSARVIRVLAWLSWLP